VGVILPSSGKTRSIFGSPLFWGIAATFLYALGFIAFLWGFANGPGSDFSWNEAGDFFAGAFAPLAFIWLVVAVFLQKSELEAQRETLEQQMEELKLSREELRLNRVMLEEQAQELKQQSIAINMQADMMSQDTLEKRLKIKVETLLRRVYREFSGFRWKVYSGELQSIYQNIVNDSLKRYIENDQILEACQDTIDYCERIRRHSLKEKGDLKSEISELEDVLSTLDREQTLSDSFASWPLLNLTKALKMLDEAKISED